ncbi:MULTISPECIES: HNH endonuclease signature motif containing protein [Mumia]|uniref:DUF222 domain-containing protein n=1 Tax=Mumia xiangluensis TaxID=1678900 RepID=A0ABW1QHS4_9ACTN|nr:MULTISPECIES: HNH endonuclease signature motif containing protein [Mumia]
MIAELKDALAAVERARGAASDADGLARLSASELASVVLLAQSVRRTAGALLVDATAVADRTQVAKSQGATSTTSWLAQTAGVSQRDASRDVELARDLSTHAPRTREALSRPGMSTDKARVINDALRKLPRDLTADERDTVESDLVDKAQRHSYEDLRRAARRAVESIDVARADRLESAALEAEETRARREATFWMTRPSDDGMVEGGFVVDALTGDILRSALEAHTAPRRQSTCDEQREAAHASGDGAASAHDDHGEPAVPSEAPDHTHKLGRAFMDVLRHLPTDAYGNHGGIAATLVVTVEAGTLTGELERAGTTSHGTRVSPTELRTMACGASLLPAVLGGDGVALDLGRRRRLFSPAQRLALALRDGGCAFPGCDRPPGWCEAHHADAWSEGGSTNSSDGALVCGHHHRQIHHAGWVMRIARDGLPEFIPPTRLDPSRTPRRNDRWRPSTAPAASAA